MIPFSATEITNKWITDVLYQNNALRKGKVLSIKIRKDGSTPFSNRIQFLDLELSPDANADAPRSVVFKAQDDAKEYYFYSELLSVSPKTPTFDYYFKGYNHQRNISIFLSPDITASHFQTQWPVPPTDDQCKKAVSILAHMHAAWWKHPRLNDVEKKLEGSKNWTKRYKKAISVLSEFIDFLGDRLSTQRRSTYEQIIPLVEKSFSQRENLTFIHGDAHFWNFMFPRNSNENQTLIFDWDMWDIGSPTDDLAYMIGLHWYPERRKRLESELLATYHQALVAEGVRSYSFDALWQDYRLSCLRNMLIPVWQWSRNIHPSVWWFHYERSFLTYEDLLCNELFQ